MDKEARYIKLRVHAGEKKPKITAKSADAFEIWVKSPAERGLANEEALGMLAATLGVARGRIRLVKGGKSPSKIVQI